MKHIPGLMIVVLSSASCSQAHPPRPAPQQPAAQQSAPAPHAHPEPSTMSSGTSHRRPQPVTGGKRVPNSSVFLPANAAPGTVVYGRAPVGSRVEFLGQDVPVDGSGGFSITLPADAHGRTPVRVVRPDGQTPITLQIEARSP